MYEHDCQHTSNDRNHIKRCGFTLLECHAALIIILIKELEQMHYLSAADYDRCMDEIINRTNFEKLRAKERVKPHERAGKESGTDRANLQYTVILDSRRAGHSCYRFCKRLPSPLPVVRKPGVKPFPATANDLLKQMCWLRCLFASLSARRNLHGTRGWKDASRY